MRPQAFRRIEAHVRICVPALLIERVAEVACDASWACIRHQLDKMQATEFFSIKHRFFRRNEITARTRSIFKKLKISVPKKILSIEKHAWTAPNLVDTRWISFIHANTQLALVRGNW